MFLHVCEHNPDPPLLARMLLNGNGYSGEGCATKKHDSLQITIHPGYQHKSPSKHTAEKKNNTGPPLPSFKFVRRSREILPRPGSFRYVCPGV